ncbi:MAG: SDR family NAD(P)-dependent oxidoreductase [Acetobacteraceae bacterium]|nr:SDR family NAD(P)-dependent oxidoreductase [Acetobacteraceae bacterium]
MDVQGAVAVVTGGASGLGLASAKRLAAKGAKVLIADLPASNGEAVAKELGGAFAAADVADEAQMQAALAQAESMGPVRVLVHCAGRGGALRILEKDGSPGSLAHYEAIIRVNLTGSFNALRLTAAAMAKTEEANGERGVCILTASIAGYEGQIGQIPYASSKAGVIGMTICAARDLASKGIRVCTIAPGIMDTPMLQRLADPIKQSLAQGVPNPHRLGMADEYAALAMHIVENGYLNGEVIRLDGALRMAPR